MPGALLLTEAWIKAKTPVPVSEDTSGRVFVAFFSSACEHEILHESIVSLLPYCPSPLGG